MKPDICAIHAMLLVLTELPRKPDIWEKNHIMINTIAGILTLKMKKKACTLANGNMNKYAPSIPEIAPEAPTKGYVALGSIKVNVRPLIAPVNK